MIKNLSYSIILILIFSFFFLVAKKYLSEDNQKKISSNRVNIDQNLSKKIENLPFLANDTNNAIEFNSGFNNLDENKPKRNFWDLLKNK